MRKVAIFKQATTQKIANNIICVKLQQLESFSIFDALNMMCAILVRPVILILKRRI